MDDLEKQKELERQKVLEQIRKRAEEAELKRIEEEEKKISSGPPRTSESVEAPLPPPPVAQTKPVSGLPPQKREQPPSQPEPLSPLEEKVEELRQKFSIAVDRGKLERAEELFEEISMLVDDEDVLRLLRKSLEKLREEGEAEQKAKQRAESQKVKELSRAQQEAQQKKVAALFEKANSFYQQEKYARAQESLNELFELDPEHDEAKELSANIAKAKELADRVREEESKHKAAEAAVAKPVEAPVPQPSGDVWGSQEAKKTEDEMGLPEVQEEPAAPPKPPLAERMVEQVSKVRIPLKPVLTVIAAGIVAVAAYVIYDSLKEAVFPAKYSLLIFPALGTSGDNTTQYLATAATEDLIKTVGVVSDLRVIAPATSLSLSEYAGDARQMARNLGASFFLQWSITRVEDRVALQITLSDTVSSPPVWTVQRQNSLREMRGAIREIAQATLREMKVETNTFEQEALSNISNASAPAYEAYAAGCWFLRQGGEGSLNNAIASMAIAVQADSLFSDGQIALAWVHLLAVERDDDSMAYHINTAWRHLNVALSQGVRSSEAYRVRGMIAQYQSQYDRAVEELERGVSYSPSDAETQRRLAVAYLIKGRLDDAVKTSMRAVTDDPRNVESYRVHGLVHLFRDEDKDALESFEQGIRFARDKSKYMSEEYADALRYTHQHDRAATVLENRATQTQYYVDYDRLGRVLQTAGRPKPQWEGKLNTAKSLILAALNANPRDARAYAYLALVETRLGAFKSALEANARARQLAPNDLDVLYDTARMYALQTDKAKALEALRKAVNQRYRLTSILDMDFYNLRSDPEFLQVVTR